MGATDRSTLTRAREKPIQGHPNPPQPMRSETHPYGLPRLQRNDKARVEQANLLIDLLQYTAHDLDKAGGALALGSPRWSYIWHPEEVKKLGSNIGWAKTEYAACARAEPGPSTRPSSATSPAWPI